MEKKEEKEEEYYLEEKTVWVGSIPDTVEKEDLEA